MRKLATAAAVSLVLASGGAQALGLGDIEMQSALNQPMNAEIRLTSVRAGETEGMIVQLASPDAFARAGIERTSALKNLRFSVDQSSNAPVIRISSTQPVVEPFLNFLLEVDWPQGRMVREYTVLLDPPVFMSPTTNNRNAGADTPAVVQSGDQSLISPIPIERNSNAAVADSFDESSVVVVGAAEEVSDTVVATSQDVAQNAAQNATQGDSGGEFISLDELDDTTQSAAGDVVVLSDLDQPNTDAAAKFAADQLAAQTAASPNTAAEIPDVELLGSSTEVSDDFVPKTQQQLDTAAVNSTVADSTAADSSESEIVSLDDLDSLASTATAANKEVSVKRGDTLYEIAQANRSGNASVQQMMMALLNANQGAFINGNINLVKAGAILRIPQASEVAQVSQAQALTQVSSQNQLWQEYRDKVRSTRATQIAQSSSGSASGAEVESATNDSDAAADTTESSGTKLSAEAKAILDSARDEILNRDELKIVADNQATTAAASATADETKNTTAARLGEVNRKLQLAREELASSRLQTGDLGDQAAELQSTSENLDALVTLRQNEVAQLEAQLAAARDKAQASDSASQDVGETAQTSVADAGDSAAVAVSDTLGDAGSDTDSLASAGVDATNEVLDTGTNALTQAGQTLEPVELLDSDADASAADNTAIAAAEVNTAIAAAEAPGEPKLWYQSLLENKSMAGVIGGLGLLTAGGLGWLLMRRRRRSDDELEFVDDVDFSQVQDVDDVDQGITADATMDVDQVDSGHDEFASGGAGGAAVADSTLNDAGADLDVAAAALDDTLADDDIDKDDTLSEVDVYLAYGLHGQAEELLGKAIARNPDNPEYAVKLLQTYHAQGNAEEFTKEAEKFHARFGVAEQFALGCDFKHGY